MVSPNAMEILCNPKQMKQKSANLGAEMALLCVPYWTQKPAHSFKLYW